MGIREERYWNEDEDGYKGGGEIKRRRSGKGWRREDRKVNERREQSKAPWNRDCVPREEQNQAEVYLHRKTDDNL